MTIATNFVQKLLTTAETAKALNISERTLHTLTHGGHIRHIKVGRANRFHLDEVERFAREGCAA
jgi:excisionase family DNA binding protein